MSGIVGKLKDYVCPRPTKQELISFIEKHDFTPESFATYFNRNLEDVEKWLDPNNTEPIPRGVGQDIVMHDAGNPFG